MSVIIGICNSKTAMLFADSRKIIPVNPANNEYLIDDEFDKVFKLSDKLLVGMTGELTEDEEICAPFINIPCDSMNIDLGCTVITRFLEDKNKSGEKLPYRTYVLSGIDKHAKTCIAYINYDSDGKLFFQKYFGQDGKKVLISLPPMLEKNKAFWNNKLTSSLKTRDGIGEIEKVKRFIHEIAKES